MSFPIVPFIVFAVSQVGTPGPANMAILATSARFGFRDTLPFTLGVILGKQAIIWPLGFGLMQLAQAAPLVFQAMTVVSALYICYLAWRVARMSLTTDTSVDRVPGFANGLIVHPMNPKAWAMITASFTFVPDTMAQLEATAWVAGVLLACQLVLQPMWGVAGEIITRTIKGTRYERGLFIGLAVLTVASVVYAIWGINR